MRGFTHRGNNIEISPTDPDGCPDLVDGLDVGPASPVRLGSKDRALLKNGWQRNNRAIKILSRLPARSLCAPRPAEPNDPARLKVGDGYTCFASGPLRCQVIPIPLLCLPPELGSFAGEGEILR